ncbi:gastrula zinc finger protein XlCGF57.1-like [Pseudomyrmex gracilis]|uniref:gastrula zinc finger protein XlCGF57.1-like n=1 Tax=Pseudomyrmex gracilis TaxID=219809 RepID=UPI000994923F|nr:gastrula zinc finger protein XlCGF57.1-like [Pseudomyrmex gracilis]
MSQVANRKLANVTVASCLRLLLLKASDNDKRIGKHFCSTCGKQYKWMQSLIRHSREECGKDPQHTCPICGTRIRHRWMVKKHIEAHHSNDRTLKPYHVPKPYAIITRVTSLSLPPYQCNTCGKSYKWKESLSLHKRMECGIEPRFTCVCCDNEVWPQSLRNQCKVCGKFYTRKSSLYTHQRVCGKEPRFVCGFCDKKFKYKHRLQSHLTLPRWVCFQCGKRYLWRGSLKNHIRVECGKDPTYTCPVCGRQFKHKHRWQSHARCMHSILL